jgi:hypothetical protein
MEIKYTINGLIPAMIAVGVLIALDPPRLTQILILALSVFMGGAIVLCGLVLGGRNETLRR